MLVMRPPCRSSCRSAAACASGESSSSGSIGRNDMPPAYRSALTYDEGPGSESRGLRRMISSLGGGADLDTRDRAHRVEHSRADRLEDLHGGLGEFAVAAQFAASQLGRILDGDGS